MNFSKKNYELQIINKRFVSKAVKITMAAVLMLSTVFAYSQSVFDKFEDYDKVSSVIVNQKTFQLMSDIGEESDEEYLNLIKNINSLKVFATEDAKIATDMETAVNGYLKTANLSELMRMKDKGNNVKIYVKEGKDSKHVKELFMFVKGIDGDKNQSVILTLTGDIDLNQISKLTKEMDLPGGEHLNKAGKN